MSTTAASIGTVVVGGGFALAFVFGAVAGKTNFCTMGALSDIVNMGHWGRMRMWLLAIAVAIVGAEPAVLRRAGRPVEVGATAADAALAVAAGRRPALRRRHDAGRRLREQEPGAPGRRQRALAGRAGVHGHRVVHDAQGPVRPVARQPGSTRCASTWPTCGWTDQGLATALARLTGLDPKTALLATACRWSRWRCWSSSSRTSASAPTRCRSSVRSCSALLVVAGWYVSGHLGYRREPRDAGERSYFAHQHAHARVDELRRAAGLRAGTADAVDRQVAARSPSASPASLGVVAGSAAYALATRQLPLGRLRLAGRPAQPAGRRRADGLRRRHRAGLHRSARACRACRRWRSARSSRWPASSPARWRR